MKNVYYSDSFFFLLFITSVLLLLSIIASQIGGIVKILETVTMQWIYLISFLLETMPHLA